MTERIVVIQGDITLQQVDAIVNSANPPLLGGGGVDGAIHKAAGPELLAECRGSGACRTGEAKITKGYNLFAHWVIHAVGPVWEGGGSSEEELPAGCYRNSLTLPWIFEIKASLFQPSARGSTGFGLTWQPRSQLGKCRIFLKRMIP